VIIERRHFSGRPFKSRPYAREGDTFEKYHPAYRNGAAAESRYGDAKFETVESDVRSEWDKLGNTADYPRGEARGAVKDLYERSSMLRKQRGTS
jgi:hypothetical protein